MKLAGVCWCCLYLRFKQKGSQHNEFIRVQASDKAARGEGEGELSPI